MIFDYCGTGKQKQYRVAISKRACLSSDKNKTCLSLINQINKTSNKGDHI